MRLDRLITLGVVNPVGRALGRFRAFDTRSTTGIRTLPVLMYHSISDDPEPSFSPYYKVCTSPARFAEQMRWLAEAGWQGVTLRAGLAWLNEGTTTVDGNGGAPTSTRDLHPPGRSDRKPVVITFDDGFRDFHTAAFPSMHEHGFSATMYLPTAFIGDTRKQFKQRDCLTWSETKELQSAGVEFGSHTVNHPILVKLPWPEIERELAESKATLEQRLGEPVPAFAYPFAYPRAHRNFPARFEEILRKTGYESCATTEIGMVFPGDKSPRVARYPVNQCDDQNLFRAKLSGAYDWMKSAQRIIKQMKALKSSQQN